MVDALDRPSPSTLTRRAVLPFVVGGAAAFLDACASPTSRGRTTSSPGSRSEDTASSARSAPAATPRGAASMPTKQEILGRFGGRSPRRWGLNLPGEVVTVPRSGKAIALTFDACGGRDGSGYDEKLIDLLRRHKVKATLDFNARWIAENESAAKELADDPLFRIANHGTRHLPLSTTGRSAYGIKGTASLSELYDEVAAARAWIAEHCPGRQILFRSGTAFSDDIGVDVCKALGMPFLGFTVNGDAGATFTPAQVTSALLGVRAGDVVISHMNHPERGTKAGYAAALPKLIDAGFTFRHLDGS